MSPVLYLLAQLVPDWKRVPRYLRLNARATLVTKQLTVVLFPALSRILKAEDNVHADRFSHNVCSIPTRPKQLYSITR